MEGKQQKKREETHGNENNTERKTKRKKFNSGYPPLIMFNVKVMFITNMLMQLININNVIFKSYTNNKLALYVKTYNDFKLVTYILRKNKVEFHSKAPREEKIISWWLKEVANDFNEEDIWNYLNKLKFKNLNIISIKINSTTFFKAQREGFAFLVKISGMSDYSELSKTTRLANQMVEWERITQKKINSML